MLTILRQVFGSQSNFGCIFFVFGCTFTCFGSIGVSKRNELPRVVSNVSFDFASFYVDTKFASYSYCHKGSAGHAKQE